MGPWLVHSRQGAEKPDDRSLDEPFLLAKSAKYLVGTRPYSKPMRKEYWRLAIKIIVAFTMEESSTKLAAISIPSLFT